MYTMDYIDAATTGTLSPHILPIMDLKKILSYIEETLPPTSHLPVSSEDTLHFYRYLHTHILIANKQFLLLIDVPIHNQSQQLSICKIFTLDIPHGNFTAHYHINTQYLGITQDETMAVEVSPHQVSICQEANGQFSFLQQPPSKCTLPICDDLDDDEEEEEDFPTVSLEGDHWTMEEILDRHLCIHEHSVMHELCPYPFPYLDYTSSSYYDTLDLSDISKFEDLMTTSSDEDIPAPDDIGY